MKHARIYLVVAVLILTSLACQTVMGARSSDSNNVPASSIPSSNDNATQPAVEATQSSSSNDTSSNASSVKTDFPMTPDAFKVMEIGDGSLLYYTQLSAEEAMQFYRDEYAKRGYTERKILTVVADGTFSIVFDGDPSGKSVVIQSVDMGDGSRTIAIRLEAV